MIGSSAGSFFLALEGLQNGVIPDVWTGKWLITVITHRSNTKEIWAARVASAVTPCSH